MPPAPLAMEREGKAPPTRKGLLASLFCPCIGDVSTAGVRFRRQEMVFYDSAKAERSLCGRVHYCLACPGWSKVTSQRVVYSRWDLVPITKAPGICCAACCDCGGEDADWLPPDPVVIRTPDKHSGTCSVPCGRTLDTFDAEIIVDASAHQTLCQICRGEGDIVLYRKAAADLSDASEVFVVPDVVAPFDVFNDVTFELSKINLQGARAGTLGARMGATVWSHDARSGADGPAQHGAQHKPWRGQQEHVYYDSLTARRTCLGYLCSHDCCCPPIYKVTSERVLYTEWDYWYPCEDPLQSLTWCMCWAGRGVARECCCAIGASEAAVERLKAKTAKQLQQSAAHPAQHHGSRCCALPVGRTAHFFDLDIVADIRAKQSCWQLCLNDGSLHFGRLAGADASHSQRTHTFFNVKSVPEVFAYFDELSIELSRMELAHFRQNAMGNDMMRAAVGLSVGSSAPRAPALNSGLTTDQNI